MGCSGSGVREDSPRCRNQAGLILGRRRAGRASGCSRRGGIRPCRPRCHLELVAIGNQQRLTTARPSGGLFVGTDAPPPLTVIRPGGVSERIPYDLSEQILGNDPWKVAGVRDWTARERTVRPALIDPQQPPGMERTRRSAPRLRRHQVVRRGNNAASSGDHRQDRLCVNFGRAELQPPGVDVKVGAGRGCSGCGQGGGGL